MKQAGYGGGIHGFGLPDWAVEGALRVSPAAIKALTPKFLGECGESTLVYGQQGRHKYKVAQGSAPVQLVNARRADDKELERIVRGSEAFRNQVQEGARGSDFQGFEQLQVACEELTDGMSEHFSSQHGTRDGGASRPCVSPRGRGQP